MFLQSSILDLKIQSRNLKTIWKCIRIRNRDFYVSAINRLATRVTSLRGCIVQVQQGEPFGDECLIHVKEMTMQREVELEVRIRHRINFA
jgi:hypothetical protein